MYGQKASDEAANRSFANDARMKNPHSLADIPAGDLTGVLQNARELRGRYDDIACRLAKLRERLYGAYPETNGVDPACPQPTGTVGELHMALGRLHECAQRINEELQRLESL